METISLEVKSRNAEVSATDVRRQDSIPCVFYGPKQENKSLEVDYQTFRRVYDKAGGNTVVELDIDGKDKENVLIHDLQHDPVSGKFTHVDFKFVDLNKEVTTDVPLVATGESNAVKDLGGTLQTRDAVTVKCMAKNIPHEIEFDISPLEDFNSSIHVSDLKLPEGVEVLDDPELSVASVAAPRAEEEEPEAEEGEEGAEATEGGEAKAEEKKEEKAEGGEAKEEKKEE